MKLEFVEVAGFRGFRDQERFELPGGFTVLSGRNGTGKSTVLDAIEFAITGTINKFLVKEARGGGLDAHLWWVGDGEAQERHVTVGFISDTGERFSINRSQAGGCDKEPAEIMDHLCSRTAVGRSSLETLMQMTLIRDEHIAALSLDLPEQARFAMLKAAIGGLVGPDYSERTGAIVAIANSAKIRQEERIKEVQNDLGRSLSALTEARSVAERSSDISEALQVIESLTESLPDDLAARTEALRKLSAEKRIALREVESVRSLAEELLPEITFLNSPEAQAHMASAQMAQETARQQKARAEEHLATAMRLEEAEKTTDEYATHLAAIVEHGSALGLQEGHCPLCNAVRSEHEFESAIVSAKAKLAEQGRRLSEARDAVARATADVTAANQASSVAQNRLQELENRRAALQRSLQKVQEVYSRRGFAAPPGDPKVAQAVLFSEQENLIRLERALSILEGSNAIERVNALEQRIAALRERGDQEAAKLAATENAAELARQIDAAAKTVQNQILTEQFDTVMPLLKELYRRLRPHTDWTEIESDFGGKVRASLNFSVGGHNPQFLFSSGQRRATGLAFLLAVHLSRPWCIWQSLLLDDPVQHIDDYRALNLVEVLSAIRRTGRQVIVAVEDTALADVLCRRLRSTQEETGRHFELRTSNTGSAEIASSQDVYPMPRLVLRPAQAS